MQGSSNWLRGVASPAGVFVAALLLALPACAAAAGVQKGRTTRRYAGHVLSGTGRYRTVRGSLAVKAVIRRRGGARYAVTMTVHGRLCAKPLRERPHRRGGRVRCVGVQGALSGSGASRSHNPDPAASIGLQGISGHITHLGRVTAKGEMNGTGIVLRGARSLTLTISTGRGTLTVVAAGPHVPGLSSP